MSTLKVIYIILFALSHISGQISIHKNITTEDGLVNSQVSAMLQDSKGYIWFGTYDGVSRWDGNHFENLQTHNGMLSSAILDIKEGPDGKIYFANYQGGIIVYDYGTLDTINEKNGLLNNAATSIAVLQNGDILLCSFGNKITKLKNGKFSNWSKEVNFPDDKYYTVRDVYEDTDGTLYFATQNGLIIYKDNHFKVLTKADGLNNDLLFGITGDGTGTIYIATYKGINKIENGIIINLTKNTKFEDAFCNKIIVTRNGTMYCATSKGIVSEKNGIIKEFTEKNGLAYNNCFSVIEDYNGTLYFGTNGKGFNIYNPEEKIINFNKNTGLPNESIWSILKASDNTLYFGSVGGLIIQKENRIKILTEKNGLSGNFIRVIKESKNNGSILVGTTKGLSILQNGSIKSFSLENNLDISQVYAILESHDGNIYLGMQTGIVVLRNGKILKEESYKFTNAIDSGLNAALVYSISESLSGMLIFSSHSGLATYEDGNFQFFTTKNGLVDNSANTIHVRSDGSIFVGTLKGINILRNGLIVDTIDVNDGLSNNSIADIEEDDKGRLFVSTYHGLNILTDLNDSLQIYQLYKKDGLIGDDFTHEGTFLDKEGYLWLGTLNGISRYNPNADLPITSPPKIYLTGIQLFNKDYSLKKFLGNPKLKYNQNFINFIYTGINLSAPEKIKYKYLLTGIDKSWVETDKNFAPYTNLHDGHYTFEVKAMNEWGYWSEPVQLSFVISPAWWETWWFYSVSILSVVLFIAFAASYRYRHLLAIEKVRGKISSDLHDSIGAGLTEISFISQLITKQTKDRVDVEDGVNNIASISKDLIIEMKDIVWLVNPKYDTLKDLFNRLQDSYQEVLRFSDINLTCKGVENLKNIRLPMTYRQNIFLIFREAINNSLKYSKCKNIWIKVMLSKNILKIQLKDDGLGFDINNITSGNGIKNFYSRAKSVNGKIEINSKVGSGTEIVFSSVISKFNFSKV